ncbi:MAG: TolC family protein [Prevotella sp.]|nr:TolC family protein [Prevotella sp.]
MNKRICIIVAAVSLSALTASAQQKWTLRQCIDYAVEHNLQIKQQDISRQQREIDVDNARHSRLPDLSASASENFSFGRGLTAQNTYTNTNTNSTSFSLGTSVPLFTGFRIPRTLELNRLNLEAATADLERAKNDIRTQVAKAYVQILYDKELCGVAQRQIDIDSMQVFRLKEMMRNGKASGTEVAQQEASLAKSRLTATQADNDLRLALLDLTQLLELPTPDGFDIEEPGQTTKRPNDPTTNTQLPSPDAIFAEAVATRPEVQAEQLRLRGFGKSIDIARAALWPSLTFQAGLGSNYYNTSGFQSDGFFKQLKNNFSQYIGLSLNVPIFNRFETRNSIRTAELNMKNQQLQLENTKKQLYKEIQQAYYTAVNAQEKLNSSQQALRSSEEAFRLMSAKYEYGKANITEFNESKNTLLTAQSDMLRAYYEYVFQRALLDFYRQRELRLQP